MPSPLSCEDVRGCIPLLVGDDLDESQPSSTAAAPSVREQVREHLDACGECAAEYLSAERAREALLGLVTEAPEDLDLWQALHLRLRSEGILGARPQSVPASADSMGRLRTWRPLAAFAGAAAAALLLGVGMWTRGLPAVTVAPSSAQSAQPLARVGAASSVAPALASSAGLRATRGNPELLGAPARTQGARTAQPGRAPIPFATLVSHGGAGRLTSSDPRSFARHVSDHRVLPATSTVLPDRVGSGSGGFAGVPPQGQGATLESGGLRRATRQDELLRHSALPWRQYFHRTRNVPIYWGENATVGFGLR